MDIGEQIKKLYNKKLLDFTYICPDDRQHMEVNNILKYVNISDPTKKLKSGYITKITTDKIYLKSLNSHMCWNISTSKNHLFYKFKINGLLDTINELFE